MVLGIYVVTEFRLTPNTEHVIQAWAILHGHLFVDTGAWHTAVYTATGKPAPLQWVPVARPINESVIWQGHQYLLHPPGAALFLLPFVAIWGEATNQTLVSVVVSALVAGLFYRLSKNLWLTAFLAFGTILWYEGVLGAAWGFTLVLSMVPTLLALTELYGEQRPAVVGFYAGCAALCRYDLAAVLLVYALWLGWRKWPAFALGLLPAFAIYLWFVNGRFGNWAVYRGVVTEPLTWNLRDKALWLWYAQDSFGGLKNPGVGPFSWRYLPSNLYTAFFMAPRCDGVFPFIHPTPTGQAIMTISPAFILALRAPLATRETLLLWAAVILGMCGALLVWANGFVQLGARYWIMVYPFLFLLIARTPIDQFAKILIIASICLSLFFTAQVRWYVF